MSLSCLENQCNDMANHSHMEESTICTKVKCCRLHDIWISRLFLGAWWASPAWRREPWLGPKKFVTVLPIIILLQVSWVKLPNFEDQQYWKVAWNASRRYGSKLGQFPTGDHSYPTAGRRVGPKEDIGRGGLHEFGDLLSQNADKGGGKEV